jgi:hypothetical protein
LLVDAADAVSAVDGHGEAFCHEYPVVMDDLVVVALAGFGIGWETGKVLTSWPLATAQTWA